MARGMISGKVLRIVLVWLLVVVLFGISPAIANAEALLPNSGSISGAVENESGDSIQGAWVYAYGESGNGVYTGADGSYSITGLAAGGYVLSAEASGYSSEYYDNVYDWSSATPVLVADLTDRPNTDFTLGPGASISGVVENESGDPIEWAWVCADGNSFGYDYTEADGSYTIADLAPGSYMVWAEADGYASQYYDDVYDQNLATPVSVIPQNDAPNINFALALGGSISGVVENESGDPIEGARVYVNENPWGGDYSGADGSYSITGLAAGGHVVGVEAPDYAGEYYNNVFDWCSATLVIVTVLNDTSNIDFALGPGGVDATPPTTPVVTDDGAATVSTSELHATWSSSDPESCIAEYQYAIGTTSGGTDLMKWTSAGANTQMTETGLSLAVGTTYYFSVKAKNGRNLWSGVGVSDGIQVTATTTPPAVTTNAANNVTTTSARLNGDLTSLGTASSVTVSFVWGTSSGSYPNETTGQAMTSTGTFYFDQGSLIPGTTYYYKGKAVGDSTVYGEEKSFPTLTTPPVVTTEVATGIDLTLATLNGNLTSLGTADNVTVSFEWGLTASYGKTTDNQTMTGTGAFSANISGLTTSTTYHYRTKAVGNGDPVYGSDMIFTTPPLPSVTTYGASDVTTSSARLNGNLTSRGSAGNVTVSFVWGINSETNPDAYPNETPSENMTITGPFYFDLPGLSLGTTYYYRAKATGNGTSYGVEMSFNTSPPSPQVTTGDASSITADSARLNGALTSLGTASSVTVSFSWGTSPESYPNETTGQAMTSTGAFYFNLGSLIPGTTYYYQAKAAGDGTSYGEERSFKTITIPPSVITNADSGVGNTSATLNGNLTGLGTASAVQVSFEWWETGKPVNTTTPQILSGTGPFYFELFGLSPGTTYYYRAKGHGDGDPVYGSDMFFASTTPPSVTTSNASNLATSSARLNGNLDSRGTAGSVTVSFVWGTSPGSHPNETTSENMTSTGLFSADLPGLSPGTTYYYQAKAAGDGTSYGVEVSFNTSIPPSVATNDATHITADSARLNGALTSLGTASSVTVSFFWGTSPESYPNETAGATKTAAGTFYFDLGSLDPRTIYYYRAKAVGDSTVYGVERTLATGQTPEIEAVDPSSGKQGQHLTITISGSNFDGATGVSFGSGIAVEGFDVNSSSAITAEIAIDGGAEVGARDVSVATIDGIGTKAGGFTVTQRGDGLPSWIWITVGIAAVLGGLGTYLVGKSRRAKP